MDPQNAVLKRREKQTLITINRSAQKSGNAYAAQGGREKPVLTASSTVYIEGEFYYGTTCMSL
jgi:hypothetical protein